MSRGLDGSFDPTAVCRRTPLVAEGPAWAMREQDGVA